MYFNLSQALSNNVNNIQRRSNDIARHEDLIRLSHFHIIKEIAFSINHGMVA